jgi:hypothetical protein
MQYLLILCRFYEHSLFISDGSGHLCVYLIPLLPFVPRYPYSTRIALRQTRIIKNSFDAHYCWIRTVLLAEVVAEVLVEEVTVEVFSTDPTIGAGGVPVGRFGAVDPTPLGHTLLPSLLDRKHLSGCVEHHVARARLTTRSKPCSCSDRQLNKNPSAIMSYCVILLAMSILM